MGQLGSLSLALACSMGAQRFDADVGQHERPPALLGFQFLKHQLLIHGLELLPDGDLPRFEVDVVPSKPGRLSQRRPQARATENSAPSRCCSAIFRKAVACSTVNGTIGRVSAAALSHGPRH